MRSILITGASSGFGRATAETLAGKGHTVFAGVRESAGRNAGAAESLVEAARAGGWKLHVLDMDVTDDASVRSAVGRAIETAGHLDTVVNNAGFSAVGFAEGYTDEQVRAIFETNFLGPQRVMRAALPHMRGRGEGLFVAVSSTLTMVMFPFLAVYTASKRALDALMEGYRYELAPLGIDSTILVSGPCATPLYGKFMSPSDTARLSGYDRPAELQQQMMQGFSAMLEGPDAPKAQEVADAIAALIEMPAGTRPLRTVVDRFLKAPVESVGGTMAGSVEQVLTGFGMGELLGVKPR
jgi:NAD(P)-dependent dehydrogenase (short-subunit alcohol dehydrogenase family)